MPLVLQLVAGGAFVYGNAFDYNRELGTDGYIDSIFNGACDMKEVPKESPYLAYVFLLIFFLHPLSYVVLLASHVGDHAPYVLTRALSSGLVLTLLPSS